MIFPSLKDKTKIFQEESKKNEMQRAATNSMAVRKNDLDRIVEEETRRRKSQVYL
jgi:hypothetical protein